MSIPGGSNPLLLASAAGGGGGYEISRSLRFNSSDSAYLSKVFSTPTDAKKQTYSFWVKRTGLGQIGGFQRAITNAYTGGSTATGIYFDSDSIQVTVTSGGDNVKSTAVFRDTSAWYHFVVAVDTTQATASNRVRIYVNGVEITSFSVASYPAINTSTQFANSSTSIIATLYNASGYWFDGYLAEFYFIDGQALDPTSFGKFDANGVWQPKAYTGTYGTNGFHLPFSDNSTAAALGTDTSGAGNDWDVYNIQAVTGGPTSVASASGALPIYNTTDTYGFTIGSGVRADSSAGSLVLATPFTTAGSNALTDDEFPSGRTSSSKTITPTGSITSDSSKYKFYGSSASFPLGAYYSTTSSDFTFGTGDFTIECWVYNPSTVEGTLFATNTNSLATTTFNSRFYGSSGQLNVYTSGGGEYITIPGNPVDQWIHLAFCRSGSTMRVFINGILKATNNSWTANLTDGGNFYINKGRDGNVGSGSRNYQDVRVYKGLAKYTSNFNPPIATQDPTVAAGNDSLVDTPTNYGTDTGVGSEVRGNYATLNPLALGGTGVSLTNGNLEFTNSAGNTGHARSSIEFSSGTWYCEVVVTGGTAHGWFGVNNRTTGEYAIYYGYDGNKWISGVGSAFGDPYGIGDVIGIAYDADTGDLTFFKNGVSQGGFITGFGGQQVAFYFTDGSSTDALSAVVNFGQRPFAYTAPSGYKALCTTNLPAPVVAQPSEVMDVKLYTGNGGTQAITTGFSPDLVWIKQRNGGTDHALFDVIRGSTAALQSSTAAAEQNLGYGNSVTFGSTGFTLGADTAGWTNYSTRFYVAWTWDAGSSTVTNTDGSITSSVRANASAGFSIVTYTGTGSNATVGHGLGVAPSLIIVKNRTSVANWSIYHSSIGATKRLKFTTDAEETLSVIWNNASPSSTVVSLGTSASVNESGSNHVAYCFAPVDGYSSFGSYTGNGLADGPFVYTGFRPRWILLKNSVQAGTNWLVVDSERNIYNPTNLDLLANSSAAENNYTPPIDFLSNGFKFKQANANYNSSSEAFVYAAFAEHPFKTARAR